MYHLNFATNAAAEKGRLSFWRAIALARSHGDVGPRKFYVDRAPFAVFGPVCGPVSDGVLMAELFHNCTEGVT